MKFNRSAVYDGHPRASHPPGGSQADPPGVSTQATGIPEFEVVVEPAGPQGIPTAGRGSKVVVDVGECALVVCGTLVCASQDEVAVGVTVAARDAVTVGGLVVRGAGALTIGGGMAVAGAGRAGGVVVTEDEVSALVGVSSD